MSERKVIGFLPARGGSKSIPLKNIKLFCGRPLIYWALHAMEDTEEVDEIYLATDSDEIEDAARSFGFRKTRVFRRSPENASDVSSTESVMLEFLKMNPLHDDDVFLLVQATTPFVTGKDITKAIHLCNREDVDSVLSCVRTKRFFWTEQGVSINYDYRNRPRRQEFAGLLMENGALYINSVGNILRDRNRLSGRILPYEMPEFTAFELDEPEDWDIAEGLMRRHIVKGTFHKPDLGE